MRNPNRGEIWFCAIRLPNLNAASLNAAPSLPPPPPSTPLSSTSSPLRRQATALAPSSSKAVDFSTSAESRARDPCSSPGSSLPPLDRAGGTAPPPRHTIVGSLLPGIAKTEPAAPPSSKPEHRRASSPRRGRARVLAAGAPPCATFFVRH
jgi:hypothetical protein